MIQTVSYIEMWVGLDGYQDILGKYCKVRLIQNDRSIYQPAKSQRSFLW